MEAGDKVKICLQDNLQSIHGAATRGYLNVVQLLIDTYGIDPAVKSKVSICVA